MRKNKGSCMVGSPISDQVAHKYTDSRLSKYCQDFYVHPPFFARVLSTHEHAGVGARIGAGSGSKIACHAQ